MKSISNRYGINFLSNCFNYPNKIINLLKPFKKKDALLLVLFYFLPICMVSAQQWQLASGPQGLNPNDVYFTRSGKLFCTNYQGLYISNDYGVTWKGISTTQQLGIFYKLTERKNGSMLAVTDKGIACSKDSGQTWTMLYNIYGLNYYTTGYISESPRDSSLFFVMDSTLFKSTDGGYNWMQEWTGNGIIDSYAIDDSGTIYLGERKGKLLKSTDGGRTFRQLTIGYSLGGSDIEHIMTNHSGGLYFFLDNGECPTIHYENNIVTEVQFGWTNLPLGVTFGGDLIYKSGNSIAIYNHITRQSEILSTPGFVKDQFAQKVTTFKNIWVSSFSSYGLDRSTDGGRFWTDINNGTGYKQCISIFLTPNGNIYTGTFGYAFWGGLFKSSDAGKSWYDLNPGNFNAYFTHIYNDGNGSLIAGGSYGVFVSDNSVSDWYKATGVSLAFSLYASKDSTIFAGDISNGLCISKDNGAHFYQSNNGIQHSYFFGFGESKTGRIFAASWPSGIYYSDNDGNKWTYINNDLTNNNDFFNFQYKNDTVFAATSGGVAFSIDNGLSWQYLNSSLSYGHINKILLSPYGDIVAASANDGIFVSKDAGISWDRLGSGLDSLNVNDMAFDKNNVLYAATNSGIFYLDRYYLPEPIYPLNGAANESDIVTLNWHKTPSISHYHLQVSTDSLFNQIVINDTTIKQETLQIGPLKYLTTYFWRVGVNTKSGNEEFSQISHFSTATPSTFSIEQNFPNPFNPLTTIVFAVPFTARAALKVYNVLGQLVATLLDQQFTKGSHEYVWNASSYSSGIYFFRLESNGFSQTIKALLLK